MFVDKLLCKGGHFLCVGSLQRLLCVGVQFCVYRQYVGLRRPYPGRGQPAILSEVSLVRRPFCPICLILKTICFTTTVCLGVHQSVRLSVKECFSA